MEKIVIEPTYNTPKVILDPDQKIFEFSGESRPKDVPKFYGPILEWLNEFGQELKKQDDRTARYEFKFSFDYFNSLTAKYILDLCKKLSNFRSEGNDIVVKWYFEKDDDDMHEVGNEMSRISDLPFEFIEVPL